MRDMLNSDDDLSGRFTENEKVRDGCSARRPDFYADCGTHAVVVECDENQHQGYTCAACDSLELVHKDDERGVITLDPRFMTETHTCTCEMYRMMTILQDSNGLPVTFVRYNPDSFSGRSDNGDGMYVDRRDALLSAVKRAMNPPTEHGLFVQYVCFDGCDTSLVSRVWRVADDTHVNENPKTFFT